MSWTNPFHRPLTDGDSPTDRSPLTGVEVRDAYERGRRDGRAERKRHPLGMTFLFVAAILGVGVGAYAMFEGSFESGGDRLDQDLSAAVDEAKPVVRHAVEGAGEQLKDAGRSIRDDRPAPKS